MLIYHIIYMVPRTFLIQTLETQDIFRMHLMITQSFKIGVFIILTFIFTNCHRKIDSNNSFDDTLKKLSSLFISIHHPNEGELLYFDTLKKESDTIFGSLSFINNKIRKDLMPYKFFELENVICLVFDEKEIPSERTIKILMQKDLISRDINQTYRFSYDRLWFVKVYRINNKYNYEIIRDRNGVFKVKN